MYIISLKSINLLINVDHTLVNRNNVYIYIYILNNTIPENYYLHYASCVNPILTELLIRFELID